jgi:hypothetical protein
LLGTVWHKISGVMHGIEPPWLSNR